MSKKVIPSHVVSTLTSNVKFEASLLNKIYIYDAFDITQIRNTN